MARRAGKIPYVLVGIVASILWFGWTAVNVNQILGVIYLSAFTVGAGLLYNWDKKRQLPFDRNGEWIMPIIQGIGIYVIFVILATLLMPVFTQIPINKLIALISTTTPALAQSQIANAITFVLFVPFVETMLFVMLLDIGADWFNYNPRDISSYGTFFAIVFLSFTFMFFHIEAKGVTNNAALMLVFLMMFVTLLATSYFGEAKQAVIFHIVANSFGLGLLSTMDNLTGVVGGDGGLFIVPLLLISTYGINKKLIKNAISNEI